MVNNTIWLDNVRTIEPIQVATAVAGEVRMLHALRRAAKWPHSSVRPALRIQPHQCQTFGSTNGTTHPHHNNY
jgi:hypothetical protein